MASTETDSSQEATLETPKLQYEVKVDKISACERHVVVTIGRAEIDRYYKQAFDEVVPKADLPGFRTGKAPRKLIESRFKSEVAEQVKNSLVIESLQDITEGDHFSAISEPKFNFKVIEVPEQGDFKYEFDIEVRPDFETPKWEGLELKRLVFNLSDSDVDKQTARTLARFSPGEAVDGAAELGDTLTLNIKFYDGDALVSETAEEVVSLRTKLTFGDAIVEDFGTLMTGVREGEKRETTVTISDSAPNPAHRGKQFKAEFEVVEIRRILIDDLTPALLDSLGFQTPAELREFVREELERQFVYHQQQDLRKQIVGTLTQGADWEMPEGLVSSQTNRELQRAWFSNSNAVGSVAIRLTNTLTWLVTTLDSRRLTHCVSTLCWKRLLSSWRLSQLQKNTIAKSSCWPSKAICRFAACVHDSKRLARWTQFATRSSSARSSNASPVLPRSAMFKIPSSSKRDTESASIDFLVSGDVADIPEAEHDNEAASFPGAPKLPEADKE